MNRLIPDKRPGGKSDRDYRCRLEWGKSGALAAADRGDIIVIVDVLSFSTSVTVAVDRGAFIYPCPMDKDAGAIAQKIGGTVTVRRREVPQKGRFSLSPLTYTDIDPGEKVVISSPNGATCSACAASTDFVLAGALVNASQVGTVVSALMSREKKSVSVIACGEIERFPDGRREIRWALEDYLGAGAVISHLACSKSADARVCEAAFLQCKHYLPDLIRECKSGQELIEWGFGADVDFSAQLDTYTCVPVLKGGRFISHRLNAHVS